MDGPTAGDHLENATAELYAGDPAGFTARRTELSKQARVAGAAEAARSIAELRRPTRSAALVNRFVREQSGLLEDVLAVGRELRAAQERLDGAALRSMGARRRQVISAAVGGALRGESPSESVRAEVTATLEAALADPDLAEQVSAGTLSRPVEWSAFGSAGPALSGPPASRAPARAAPRPPRATGDQATKSAKSERATAQQSRVAEAERTRIAEAETDVREAQQAVAATSDRRDAATALVGELEEQLAQARLDLRAASAQLRSAQERSAAAQRRMDRTGRPRS